MNSFLPEVTPGPGHLKCDDELFYDEINRTWQVGIEFPHGHTFGFLTLDEMVILRDHLDKLIKEKNGTL